MSLERIAAASLPHQVSQAGSATPANRIAPGEMIHLTLDATAADGMLATTADGLQLRLTGLGSLAQSLAPGETLNLRVLATIPRIELALLDTTARPSGFSATITADAIEPDKTAAMRLDQVALLRQVIPPRPDAAALASSWRALALDHFERHASFPGQVLELRLPANLFIGGSGSANGRDANAAHPVPSAEQWLFAPSAYGSHRVLLNVIDASDDDPMSRQKRKRRRTAIALLLASILPGIGRIVVRMQLVSGGVLLDLHCEEKALALLRKLLPDIVASVVRADLRVVRCRLMRTPPLNTKNGLNLQTDVSATLALPSALFRAAAEVLLLLSSPSLPAIVNRRCR